MEGLSYYNLEDLIGKVASGELDIHRPIELSNDVHNQRFEIPFLQHLLMICKNEGFSLVHLLSMMHCQIKQNILEMKTQKCRITTTESKQNHTLRDFDPQRPFSLLPPLARFLLQLFYSRCPVLLI